MNYIYTILSILVAMYFYKKLVKYQYKKRYQNIFLRFSDDKKRIFVLTPLIIDRFNYTDKEDVSDYSFNRICEIDDEISKIKTEDSEKLLARGLGLIEDMVEDHSDNSNVYIYSLIQAMPLTKALLALQKS